MKQINLLFSLLLVTILSIPKANAQIALERKKVTKEISMKVPVDFLDMTPAERVNKYVSSRAPIAMYTSSDRNVDLGINENSSSWPGGDLTILQSFHKANIVNLFTEVKFIQEEIKMIGDREFIVFEFVSRISDEQSTFGGNTSISKYTYIQYTLRNDKVLLFNFTCPNRQRAQYQEAAKEIMESIRIKS
ncbi:MAG: hypothetical protein JXR10_14905 [Cyclobacteriaceae bacterium]